MNKLTKQIFRKYCIKNQSDNIKKNILIFGAPGSGKGTYSQLLEKDFDIDHISIGDELRKLVKQINQKQDIGLNNLNLNQKTIDDIQKGRLIDNNIVCQIIQQIISQKNKNRLIDGFPRNFNQYKYMGLQQIKIDLVVNIKLRRDILQQKLQGRRVCLNCKKSYNICNINRDGYCMPALNPLNAGQCDNCQTNLIQREDDTEKVINSRLNDYFANTFTLLQIFQQDQIPVYHFEPKNGIKDYPLLYSYIKTIIQ